MAAVSFYGVYGIKDLADSLTAAEESLAYENLISPARHKIISIINC